MKKRTVLGAILIVLALFVSFVIAPYVNNKNTDVMNVLRLTRNVAAGEQITEQHIEMVTVKKGSISDDVLTDASTIIGKYAVSKLYKGDYLVAQKLSENIVANENNEDKYQISIPAPVLAGMYSGKLRNGDIVRFYISIPNEQGQYYVETPEELQWVQIVTTTTAEGIDYENLPVNTDGSHIMPATITFYVNEQQAKLLATYSTGYNMHLAFVCHENDSKAASYLAQQDEILQKLEEKETPENELPEMPAAELSENKDKT